MLTHYIYNNSNFPDFPKFALFGYIRDKFFDYPKPYFVLARLSNEIKTELYAFFNALHLTCIKG